MPQKRKSSNRVSSAVKIISCGVDENSSRDMLTQILLTCLRQAQCNDCFQMVCQQQRNHILRYVWLELFILKASHWPIDVSQAIERVCGDRHLLEVISATRNLKADLMELSLLEIMILCRPELACTDEDARILQLNSENALNRLALYVFSMTERQHQQQRNMKMQISLCSPNKFQTAAQMSSIQIQSVTRLGKLLLALRQLSSMRSYESSMNNLFCGGIAEELLQLKI
jgi:hypothetical protein